MMDESSIVDGIIGLLTSWPGYEVVLFSLGMLAGYGVALWQRRERKRERYKRKIERRARRLEREAELAREHRNDAG